jgi:heterodisulfide reductase subunit B2
MKYAFYLGCVIPARLFAYEASSRKVCKELGIELVDMENYICCGTPIEAVSHKTWLAMSAYNLALAQEKGLDILTLCNGCANSLRMVNAKLKEDPGLLKEINGVLEKLDMGMEYRGGVDVKHFIKVLYEDVGIEEIKKKVKKPLTELVAASHVGCHVLRPGKVMRHDSPERPRILDELIEATGAKTVDYLYKTECCGQPIRGLNDDVSLALLQKKLGNIKDAKANVLVTICPACNMQFDMGQVEIRQKFKVNYDIPVMHYPELLGLAFGMSKEELGVQTHKIKPVNLMKMIRC